MLEAHCDSKTSTSTLESPSQKILCEMSNCDIFQCCTIEIVRQLNKFYGNGGFETKKYTLKSAATLFTKQR